jgi:hypothetical protein
MAGAAWSALLFSSSQRELAGKVPTTLHRRLLFAAGCGSG